MLASISGQLIHDADGSGANNGEQGWTGAVIELIDQSQQVVATATSADVDLNGDDLIDPFTEQGVFEFSGLDVGSYGFRIQSGSGDLLTWQDPVEGLGVVLVGENIGGVELGIYPNVELEQSTLDAIVAAAHTRWADAGLSTLQLDKLAQLSFVPQDLDGLLTSRDGKSVFVDSVLPGPGWFADATPADDKEFRVFDEPSLLLGAGVAVKENYDLLSFVTENMRLELGDESRPLDASDIGVGSRRLVPAAQPRWWDDATISHQAEAGWFDGEWSHRRAIVVSNENSEDIDRAQFELRLDSSDIDFNKVRADGGDIRITDADGLTPIKHWIEHFDAVDENAVLMVQSPSLSEGEQRTLYVYFGNAQANDQQDWSDVFPGERVVFAPERALVANGTTYDAFPAAERLANGDLLIAFRGGSSHAGPDGSIILARSTDGGSTWSSQTIFDDPETDDRVNVGMTQLADGTLVLPIVQYADEPTNALMLKSVDNGLSWSPATLINHHFDDWVFPYGKVLESPSGTLEMPVYGEYKNGRRDIAILESIRGSDTWSLKSTVDTRAFGSGFGEMSVVAINDTDYVSVYRDANEIYQRNSFDGGITWGAETHLFDGVSPDLLKLTNGDVLLCVGDRVGVEGVRCHISTDDGASWGSGAMVATSFVGQFLDGGYPASIELADGRLMTSFYYRSSGDLDIDQVTYSPSFVLQAGQPSHNSGFIRDGLEVGELSEWTTAGDSTVVSSATTRHGDFALRIADSDSRQLNKAVRELYPIDRSQGGVSFWAYLDGTSPQGASFWLGDSGVSPAFNPFGDDTLAANTSHSVFQIDWTADGLITPRGASETAAPLASVAVDGWHKFSLYFDTVSGKAELFVDGVSSGSFDDVTPAQGIRYFGVSSSGAATLGDVVYLDDLYTHSPSNASIVVATPESETTLPSGGERQVTVVTSNDVDDVEFEAGPQRHRIQVDGESYFLSTDLAHDIRVTGSGSNAIQVTGLPNAETATLAPKRGSVKGANYQAFLLEFASVVVDGNGGLDDATLIDADGDDQFWARPASSYLQGHGYLNEVRGFAEVAAYALAGDDTARMFDSHGNEQFIARDNSARLLGDGFEYQATGFDRVYAQATEGNDHSKMYDSPSDDRFVGRETYSYLEGPEFLNQASGFDSVTAYSMKGGRDSIALRLVSQRSICRPTNLFIHDRREFPKRSAWIR